MYTPESIQARLRERPFRPFRIVASEGLRYEIKHPDLVLVGRHDVMIGYADDRSPLIYDRLVRVALAHIVALDELPIEAGA